MKKHSGIFQFVTFFFGLGCICIYGAVLALGEYIVGVLTFALGVFLIWNKSFYHGKVVYIAYWIWAGILLADGCMFCAMSNTLNEEFKYRTMVCGLSFILGGTVFATRAILHKKWGLIGAIYDNPKSKMPQQIQKIYEKRPVHLQQKNSCETQCAQFKQNLVQQEQSHIQPQQSLAHTKEFSMDDIDQISNITGKKMKGDLFEQYCARLLELNMFSNVQVVGGSGDLGADIIAWKGNRKYCIQCKCYSNTVPYHALEQTVTARKNVGASEAILLSNNYFSKQTRQIAPEHQIVLWDRDKLAKLIDNANAVLESK